MSRRPAAGRIGSVAPRPMAARASAAMPLRLPRQSVRQGPGSARASPRAACRARRSPPAAAAAPRRRPPAPGRAGSAAAGRCGGSGTSPSRLTTSGESGSAAKRTRPLAAEQQEAAAGDRRLRVVPLLEGQLGPCRRGDLQRHHVVLAAAAAPPTRAHRQQPLPARSRSSGSASAKRQIAGACTAPGACPAATRRRRKAGASTASACAGSRNSAHRRPVDLEQREARRLGRLQRRQRARRQQRRVALAQQPQQVVALPLGGREHALGTAAVEEAGFRQVLAAEAGARRPAARNPNPRSRPAWWWCRSAGRARRPPAAPGCRPRSSSAR